MAIEDLPQDLNRTVLSWWVENDEPQEVIFVAPYDCLLEEVAAVSHTLNSGDTTIFVLNRTQGGALIAGATFSDQAAFAPETIRPASAIPVLAGDVVSINFGSATPSDWFWSLTFRRAS